MWMSLQSPRPGGLPNEIDGDARHLGYEKKFR